MNRTVTRSALSLVFIISLTASLLPGSPPLSDIACREDPNRWIPPDLERPYSAADIARDCNDDGFVDVRGDLEVRWGSGILSRDCTVALADGVQLRFEHAALSGSFGLDLQGGNESSLSMNDSRFLLGLLISFESGDRGSCEISGSELRTEADGQIRLSPGGSGSAVRMLDTVLSSGGDIVVAASISGSDGAISLHRAELTAGGGTTDAVSIHASLEGLRGTVQVEECALSGRERIEIMTGDLGRVEVNGSTLDTPGAVLITTGEGGTCVAADNEPPVECEGDRMSLDPGAGLSLRLGRLLQHRQMLAVGRARRGVVGELQ